MDILGNIAELFNMSRTSVFIFVFYVFSFVVGIIVSVVVIIKCRRERI